MSKPQTPGPIRETHLLSIRSHLDNTTLFLSPASERGMVRLQLRNVDSPLAPPPPILIPAQALLLAATSIHAIINEVNPS